MPELPEVEAARKAIAENCVGKKIIRSVVADDAKVIDGVSRFDFEASLTGKTIIGADRKGKNMWIRLDSPPFPSFHFGLSGAIHIKGVSVTKYKRFAVNDTNKWPSKYSKLFIELDDGLELSFTDKIRFARVRLLENPAAMPPISELGPDALLEAMSEDELFKALSKKKTAIKALLLNQSFISGVGNWIADEVLYQAQIHPLQRASSIPKEGCAALHKSLKEVIEYSVEVDADYSRLPVDWLCHSRWGKKPGKINGQTIEFINAGGRTSAYVPELQKLSGDQAIKAQKKSNHKKNDNEAESESEEIAKNAKPKGGKITTETLAKKQSVKHNNKISDDGNDDEKKLTIRKKSKVSSGNKKLTARKKSHESESDSESKSDTDNSGGGGGDKKLTMRKKSNGGSRNKKLIARKKTLESKSESESDGDNSESESDSDNDDGGGGDDDNEVIDIEEVAKKMKTSRQINIMMGKKPKSIRNAQNPNHLGRVFEYGIEKNIFCGYESDTRLGDFLSHYLKPYTWLPKSNEIALNLNYPGRIFVYGVQKKLFCCHLTTISLNNSRPNYPKIYTGLSGSSRNYPKPKTSGHQGQVFGYEIGKKIFCRYGTGRLNYPKAYIRLLKPYTRIMYPKIFNFYSSLILV